MKRSLKIRLVLSVAAISAILWLAAIAKLAHGQTLPLVVQTTSSCATSADGSVVGVLNPLQAPTASPVFSGTLPAATYYIEITWYDAAGNQTLGSPEVSAQLSASGSIQVFQPASGRPAPAIGFRVYMATSTGAETLQGSTTGTSFTQSVPLVSGAALPSINSTICQQIANDAGWPVAGYTVSIIDVNGNTLPSYPMQWQLIGPGSITRVNQGLPYWNGNVQYPVPILAQPYNHAPQSISGPLSMQGYNLYQVGRIGVGTLTPGWGVDAEQGGGSPLLGLINASNGYLINGVPPSGTVCMGSTDGVAIDVYLPCLSTIPSYQTVASNGTAQTKRPVLNFSPRFVLTDSVSPGETTVDLATVVAPGTYANPLITLDAYGRVTAVAAGGTTLGALAASVADSCPGGNCSGYFPTAGGGYFEATVSGTGWPAPAVATLSSLFVETSNSPTGLGITSLQFTIYQNGSPTSVTCTITSTASACDDITHTITAAQGDLFSTQVTAVGTASGTVQIITSLL